MVPFFFLQITRIEYVHSKGFLHRDIKPENFLIGIHGKKNVVYIIDFGLAKKYRDSRTHSHIPYKKKKSLTGTPRYASLNSHTGEQSRRDDLESLGFIFVYFLKGKLPWQGLKANSKREKYAMIREKKRSTSIEKLCKGLPVEFAQYLKYIRSSLRFEEKPDYGYLRQLFSKLFRSKHYTPDFLYDWCKEKRFSSSSSRPLTEKRRLHSSSRNIRYGTSSGRRKPITVQRATQPIMVSTQQTQPKHSSNTRRMHTTLANSTLFGSIKRGHFTG